MQHDDIHLSIDELNWLMSKFSSWVMYNMQVPLINKKKTQSMVNIGISLCFFPKQKGTILWRSWTEPIELIFYPNWYY